MTLDEARIAEAERRAGKDLLAIGGKTFSRHLCDVFNENWTPPVVDPDLLAARAWAETTDMGAPTLYDDGSYDTEPEIIGFLAGCTRGREETKGLVEALEHLRIAIREAPMATFIARHMTQVIDDALASAKRGG
jgi:hypothetical protein